MTLSYHLSINKEKRPQHAARPSGLLNNPDKINTPILTQKALEHYSIDLSKGLRLQILSTNAMDILWKSARAFLPANLPIFT